METCHPNQSSNINANNLDLILPIVDTLERYNSDLENQLEAIIQRIHCNTPVFIGNSK
jgi:uncharacterized membrane protein